MDYFDEFEFKSPKQQRTKKVIDDLVESLELLAQSEDLTQITTRNLSDISGYALGTIFHHFKKFDDIFVYFFLIRRKKATLIIIDIINQHPADLPLSILISKVNNHYFYELSRPNRKALLFLMHQFFKCTQSPELINIIADSLIPYWMEASVRDKTNTIFNFSENELKLRFRAMQSIVRSPFFEDDPIAGTKEHKDIAFKLFMQMFTNTDLIE